MKQLVFDIETSGTPFEALDEETRAYLLKRADTPEKEQKVKDELNLWPLTGEVVAIGVLDVVSERGSVYFQSPTKTVTPFEEHGVQYLPGTETECLQRFWADCMDADRIITFNGRGFDAPWLFIRSLVNGVRATRNIMPPRYSTNFHVDLADQLSFYSATRHFALAFWCKTLGIASPKHDISGAEVPERYRAGEYERIARYCMDDVRATRELFLKWRCTLGDL